jgi:uncharacterized membrane protein
MVTEAWQVEGIHAIWVENSGAALWPLAAWSARRKMLISVLVVAALVTTICITLLAQAFPTTLELRRTPLEFLLASHAPPLLLTFLIRPFPACIAIAQISRRVSTNFLATRWISFAGGLFIALISPPCSYQAAP